MKKRPVPTEAEILSAHNMSTVSFPRGIQNYDWRCPVCDRSLREIVYCGKRGDWRFFVVMHHDHGRPQRFAVTPICEDCNHIDAKVKNHMQQKGIDMPHGKWSFSPDEMKTVISGIQPHQQHVIDYQKAVILAQNVIGYSSRTVQPSEGAMTVTEQNREPA